MTTYSVRAMRYVVSIVLSAMVAACASDIAQSPGPSHVLMPVEEDPNRAIVCGLGEPNDRDTEEGKRCTTPPEREDRREDETEAKLPDR
jgi:hypothetical protein